MRPYTEEAISGALAEIRQGSLSLRKASKKYSVPVTTLHDRKSGKVVEGAKWGKKALLPISTEQELIKYAMKRADLGIGFSKRNFLRFAGNFAKSEGIPFQGGVATEKWWRGLRKRHQEFSLRTPEPTSSGRHTSMNRLHVSRYFSELKTVLEKNDLFNNGSRIWNMDETGLNLSPKRPKIIARKGSKVIHAKSSQSRELVTIIACGNAAGKVIPPHVIIPGKTKRVLQGYDIENAPKGTMLSVSDSGWTKKGISELWFDQTFLPNIGSSRPQLLIMDGHDSHHHVELVTKAREAGIIIMELPAKTSHFTQPFDRSVFKALKSRWSEEINTFTATTGVTVGHSQFFRMLRPAWENSMTLINISSGFIATGICPYNPGAIPDVAYVPSDLYSDMSPSVDESNEIPISSAERSTNSIAVPTHDQGLTKDVVVSIDIPATSNSDMIELPVTVGADGSLSVNPVSETVTGTESFDISVEQLQDNNPASFGLVLDAVVSPLSSQSLVEQLESQIDPIPSTSASTVTECTSEMALSVIESAITDDKRKLYENAIERGIDIDDSMFHTWVTYQKKVHPGNMYNTNPVQGMSNPLLTLPKQPVKKKNKATNKKSFFVITADEAYKEQVEAKLAKQKKAEQLEERKKIRLMKQESKVKKSIKKE